MNGTNERQGASPDAAGEAGFEFRVEGATISVAFSGHDAARDASPSLEKAKRAIARLASLQESEMARQSQARQGQPGIREMPNVFDYWAYRRD